MTLNVKDMKMVLLGKRRPILLWHTPIAKPNLLRAQVFLPGSGQFLGWNLRTQFMRLI